ncbi:MAG: hypothetical protein J0H75_05460, partial [Rhizobiales bacterium]|nr:hypothetical protein [Hyphomicrobiales bacterium]
LRASACPELSVKVRSAARRQSGILQRFLAIGLLRGLVHPLSGSGSGFRFQVFSCFARPDAAAVGSGGWKSY